MVRFGRIAHQDTYQLRLPFPKAWAVIPLPYLGELMSRRPHGTDVPPIRGQSGVQSLGLVYLFMSVESWLG